MFDWIHMSRKSPKPARPTAPPTDAEREAEVRIIGGRFRGRRLNFHGDPVVRPMKHRTREALFNLIGTRCAGRHVIDLFAGTGAIGFEALSRGAPSLTLIEKHVPTARVVEQNIALLGVAETASLQVTSAFLWAKRDLPAAAAMADKPWLVFCSPPYAFYRERPGEMVDLLRRMCEALPPESVLVVEAEEPFDFQLLLEQLPPKLAIGHWDIRTYSPAVVGIWSAEPASPPDSRSVSGR